MDRKVYETPNPSFSSSTADHFLLTIDVARAPTRTIYLSFQPTLNIPLTCL